MVDFLDFLLLTSDFAVKLYSSMMNFPFIAYKRPIYHSYDLNWKSRLL